MKGREILFLVRFYWEEKELRNSSGKKMIRLKTWVLVSINPTWGFGHDNNLITVYFHKKLATDGYWIISLAYNTKDPSDITIISKDNTKLNVIIKGGSISLWTSYFLK